MKKPVKKSKKRVPAKKSPRKKPARKLGDRKKNGASKAPKMTGKATKTNGAAHTNKLSFDALVQVLVPSHARNVIQQLANAEGMSMSSYLRRMVLIEIKTQKENGSLWASTKRG